MTDWTWISADLLHLIHDEQIAEHGGLPGVRDENGLLSALARPQQLANYGEPDLAELAASYLFGLAKNHGYSDGNKRAAWAVARTFLLLNGYGVVTNGIDAVRMVEAVAASEFNESEVADWFRARLQKDKGQPHG
jgi:death on curing protein